MSISLQLPDAVRRVRESSLVHGLLAYELVLLDDFRGQCEGEEEL
jgi:hypothetical protein